MKRLVLLVLAMMCVVAIFSHPKVEINGFSGTREVRADSLHGFDVTKYEISLTIDEAQQTISGTVLAEVTAEENLTSISYELESLNVDNVKVNNQTVAYTFENGLINIPLNVSNGEEFTTLVSYSGDPTLSDDGYNIGMIFRTNSVFTVSDPNAGRYWWPSYDHPWDKAIIDFNVTCRSDWLSACNGLQGETIDNGNGTITAEWIGENPMSTYLAVVHIGPYQVIEQTYVNGEGENIPIQHFVQANYYDDCLVDFERVPEMMETYANLYGEYPFEKYGQALVNMQTFGAMEHQTMTTLGNNFIDGSPNDPEYTVAHELSHHWFGDCLTPLTWKDVWLSEGFATYSEAIWANHLLGYEAMIEYTSINIQNYYLNWSNSNGSQIIYDPSYLSYFTPPSYEKAASVLHMLRLEVGDTAFWQIISTWFENNKYGNIVTEEFIAQCEAISGLDLEQFFNQWIYSPGIPSYEFMTFVNYETNQIKFLNEVTSNTDTQFELSIPIYTNSDSVNVKFTPEVDLSNTATLDGDMNTLEIDRDNWNLVHSRTEGQIYIADVYAGDSSALVSWGSNLNLSTTDIDVLGYKIYKKKVSEDDWQEVITEPITGNQNVVDGLENGETYHFYVTLEIADGFETLPSIGTDIQATPTEFTGANTILLVDDTPNGTGGLLSPTDEDVDSYYESTIFGGYDVDSFDLANDGELTWEMISNYRAVVWFNDSVTSSSIGEYSNLIGNYLFSGGKIVFSGWKVSVDIPSDFFSTFISNGDFSINNMPELNQVESELFPTLHTRADLFPSAWNGNIGMITSFTGANNTLYTKPGTDTPIAISNSNDNWEVYLFGFPLYYMNGSEVRSMMLSLLSNTTPPVSNSDDTEVAGIEYNIYPNPAKNYIMISSNSKTVPQKIVLFNIKGQKVSQFNNLNAKDGKIAIDLKEKKLANGIYFVKIYSNSNNYTDKIIIMK